jgi:hypothetical protein
VRVSPLFAPGAVVARNEAVEAADLSVVRGLLILEGKLGSFELLAAFLYGVCGLLHIDPVEARRRIAAARNGPLILVSVFDSDFGVQVPLAQALEPATGVDLIRLQMQWHYYHVVSLERASTHARNLGRDELVRELSTETHARMRDLVAYARAELPALPREDSMRGHWVEATLHCWFRLAYDARELACDDATALRLYLELLESPWIRPGDPAAAQVQDLVRDATINAALLAEAVGNFPLARRLYGGLPATDDASLSSASAFRASLMQFRIDAAASAGTLEAFAADAATLPEHRALALWYAARAHHAAGRTADRDRALAELLRAFEPLDPQDRAQLEPVVAAARAILDGGPMPEPAPDPSPPHVDPPEGCR